MSKPICAVLGVGPGVGEAIARRFARAGHHALLMARDADKLAATAAAFAADGLSASIAPVDAADPAAVAAALAAAGPVDVFVHNAVGVTMATPTALTPEALVRDFTISVASALAGARAVAPAMIAAGRGTILLTGGGFALRPMAALASLGVAKAATRNLAFSLAEELSPMGVRVGTVTILGMVKPGTPFDPAAIADAFFSLHADRAGDLGVELQFSGSTEARRAA